MRRMLITSLAAALMAAAALNVAEAKSPRTELRTTLVGTKDFPAAKGKAKYKESGQKELEVEVENLKRIAGAKLSVFVGGTNIGQLKVDSFGQGEIEVRGRAVPTVTAGMTVVVKRGDDVPVVAGKF